MGLWRSFLPFEFLQKNNNNKRSQILKVLLLSLRQVLARKQFLYYYSYIYVALLIPMYDKMFNKRKNLRLSVENNSKCLTVCVNIRRPKYTHISRSNGQRKDVSLTTPQS